MGEPAPPIPGSDSNNNCCRDPEPANIGEMWKRRGWARLATARRPPCVEGACSVQTAQLLHQMGDAFHCGATWHGSHNCLGAVPPAAGSHAGHMIGAYSGKGHCRVQWEGR
jgi:hypothetical protein